MDTKRVIAFKLSSGEYGCFSNFYKKIIIAEGIKFKTSEHYYHYRKMKFLQALGEPVTDEFIQLIIDAPTAKKTKRLGHTRMNNIDKWDEIKVEEMMIILRAKFQYERFRDILIETGDAIIVENSYFDTFWGCGNYKNKGLNMLGKCLMRLRDELTQMNED